jgi:Fe-S-cluster containining protein
MSMSFFGGEVDDDARDEIHWMELHGFKIDYTQKLGQTEYYFSIPQRCNALQEVKTDAGATNYVCGVYETRPQMCRDYDGNERPVRCEGLSVEVRIRRTTAINNKSRAASTARSLALRFVCIC